MQSGELARITCKELVAAGLPPDAISLDGSTSEGWCLRHEPPSWTVRHVERGVRTREQRFATEAEACEYLRRQVSDVLRPAALHAPPGTGVDGWTRAQQSTAAEALRHPRHAGVVWGKLSTRVLDADEVVLAAFVGRGSSDPEPCLVLTDRRVLRFAPNLLGWSRLHGEIPGPLVAGASLRQTWLSQVVRVDSIDGRHLQVAGNDRDLGERFVGMVQALVAGRRGTPHDPGRASG